VRGRARPGVRRGSSSERRRHPTPMPTPRHAQGYPSLVHMQLTELHRPKAEFVLSRALGAREKISRRLWSRIVGPSSAGAHRRNPRRTASTPAVSTIPRRPNLTQRCGPNRRLILSRALRARERITSHSCLASSGHLRPVLTFEILDGRQVRLRFRRFRADQI